MEKISGIIPSSARVTNVDMKDAHPVRAGVPTFGRPEAPTRMNSDAMLAQPEWKGKDARHAAIVNDVASSFFMKPKAEPMSDASASSAEAPLQQPDGLFPKGSFLDRNA